MKTICLKCQAQIEIPPDLQGQPFICPSCRAQIGDPPAHALVPSHDGRALALWVLAMLNAIVGVGLIIVGIVAAVNHHMETALPLGLVGGILWCTGMVIWAVLWLGDIIRGK